ncbi:hypothetical protein [Streptomyces chartreusis]|uniref:hypothetical protein n=1 Tax=Streptomyces chartreusis TaxID=1969 RepID=UPI0037B4AFC4
MSAAEWMTAIGTLSAATAAVGIALAQNRVVAASQRGERFEKASLIVVGDLTDDSKVTVRNLGTTSVTDVRVDSTEASTVAAWPGQEAEYRILAHRIPIKERLAPGETHDFDVVSEQKGDPKTVSILLDYLEIPILYRDVYGTVWRRLGNRLPCVKGGTPLPGTAAYVRWIRRASALSPSDDEW